VSQEVSSKDLDGKNKDLLRNWTEDRFEKEYDCDRFTATVLSNRLRHAAEHMSTGLMAGSFSPIISDWFDFAISISGPPDMDYPLPAVGSSLLVFLGTMEDACRNIVEEYGPERLKPGDVLLCNDPYRNGLHVNDVSFIRPVFFEGKPIAFISIRAHQLDMGGTVPGGFSSTKANVFETGLVIGPTLLFENDEPVPTTFSLIFDNTRFGGLLQADFMTVLRQLKLGEELVEGIINRYGEKAYRGTVRYCCDASAETMRDSFEILPDGTYAGEERIDADGAGDDGEFVIRVKVTKASGRIEVDLSGSSRQARTCINAGPLDVKTVVASALMILFDRNSPFTSGTLRYVDIVIPPGTIMSALPPDGAIYVYWEPQFALLSAIIRELGKAVGDRAIGGDFSAMGVHNAHGERKDGTPWINVAVSGAEHGPWGGDKDNDGDSYMFTYPVNAYDPPTETMEQDCPVLMMRKEYVPDTAGAGENRGGASVVKDVLWCEPAEHHSLMIRTKRPAGYGANGGMRGKGGAAWFFDPEVVPENGLISFENDVYSGSTPLVGMCDPSTHAPNIDGEYFYFAREIPWKTRAGTMSRYLTNGGGGWGKVLDRNQERVLSDVRNGYVSIEQARDTYKVVISGDPQNDPEGLRIDETATKSIRKHRV